MRPALVEAVIAALGWKVERDHHGEFMVDATGMWVADKETPAAIATAVLTVADAELPGALDRIATLEKALQPFTAPLFRIRDGKIAYYVTKAEVAAARRAVEEVK